MADVPAIAAVVSSVAAAVAAGASWRSSSQARATAREGRLPYLHAQISRDDGRYYITIENAGSGIAKGVGFLVVGDGEKCLGVIPKPGGFLQAESGASCEMLFSDSLPKKPAGVFFCRDLEEFPRYWTLRGGPPIVLSKLSWRSLRRVPKYHGDIEVAARELLGDLQLNGLRQVGIAELSGYPNEEAPSDNP